MRFDVTEARPRSPSKRTPVMSPCIATLSTPITGKPPLSATPAARRTAPSTKSAVSPSEVVDVLGVQDAAVGDLRRDPVVGEGRVGAQLSLGHDALEGPMAEVQRSTQNHWQHLVPRRHPYTRVRGEELMRLREVTSAQRGEYTMLAEAARSPEVVERVCQLCAR